MSDLDIEAELLALRLRTATAERRREAAAARRDEEDALHRRPPLQRVARGLALRAGIEELVNPAAAVAAGYGGVGLEGVRVPLAGYASAGPRWHDALSVAGVELAAVECPPPETLSLRVAGGRGAVVRAFAALRPGAWFRNRGGVAFTLRAVGSDGTVLGETVRVLDPAQRPADRAWRPLVLALPDADVCDVELRTTVPDGAAGDYAWAVWGDPVVLVPAPGMSVAPLPGARDLVGSLRRTHAPGAGPSAARETPPTITILLPVHDPAPELLRATLASVLAQTDPAWELCVTDDASSDEQVIAILDEASADPRVVVQRTPRAGGISAATNLAFSRATGMYVATLDHDDLLAPDAIATVRQTLAAAPDTDVLYSDNDKVGPGGERFAPALKPGWSPELLRACMYTLHLSAYRRALVEEVGGWRPEFDGAQDHDLVLRLSERNPRIAHIAATLAGWRAHAGSAALGALAKPEAYDRGARAVAEHVARMGVPADVDRLEPAGRYRVRYSRPGWSRIAAVLPLGGGGPAPGDDVVLARLAQAFAAAPAEMTFVLVLGTHDPEPAFVPDKTLLVRTEVPSWGAAARAGADAVDADGLILIQELSAPGGEDWLEELTGPLQIPGVVASAPVVQDAAGRVMHAGVVLSGGLPLPVHRGRAATGTDVADELLMVTNRASLSGVVAVGRETLVSARPAWETFDAQALPALVAGLTATGGRAVCSPHAPWYASAPGAGGVVDLQELRRFAREHRGRTDEWFNPRLWQDRADHLIPAALEHVVSGA